jgi:hypothetical protein
MTEDVNASGKGHVTSIPRVGLISLSSLSPANAKSTTNQDIDAMSSSASASASASALPSAERVMQHMEDARDPAAYLRATTATAECEVGGDQSEQHAGRDDSGGGQPPKTAGGKLDVDMHT